MFKLFGKKKETVSKAGRLPEIVMQPAMVTLEAHNRLAKEMQRRLDDTLDELRIERDTVARIYKREQAALADLTAARAEAEANKVDAERYRAKLKRDRDYHAERRVQVKAEVA